MEAIPPPKLKCHRTGFTKSCQKLVVGGACNRWVPLRGVDPNTGQEIDSYNCIDNWSIKVQLELGNQMRQMGAAVEDFRNEMLALNGFPDGVPRVSHTTKPRQLGNGHKD